MVVKYFLSGLFVKLLAGFDDTMTRIPIMANMTKTKKGRIAFAIGIFIAVALVTAFAFVFASVIRSIPYSRYISAILIFALAMFIHFDLFTEKPKKKIRKKLQHVRRVSVERFFKLMGFGFLTAFATIIDDTIAYSGLFLNTLANPIPVILGIFSGTILQLIVIVYFSQKFSKLKYQKEITVFGLVLLSLIIALGFL
jgi:putative Ca2+/H+ antiporter (TMEM165/GDT1 family)